MDTVDPTDRTSPPLHRRYSTGTLYASDPNPGCHFMKTIPEQRFQPGQEHGAFRIRAVTPVPATRSIAYEIVHPRSGARILHLHNQDTENLFSITFPTTPPDDCGLPHILEHAVLSGSKRFPVRDPFFELLKMSAATFLNALTGPDCTYYPVASNLEADLFNLAEVYFDAVFHPLLTQNTFGREGHHLRPADPANPTGDLTVDGIVYSEMKSYYSQPETRLMREAGRHLFPDSPYGREFGGDPEAIPNLTFEDFREFHRRVYHPANARFVLYGNIPTERYLEFLEPRLASFQAIEPPPPITPQPRWDAPRAIEDTYAIAPDEELSEKTFLTLHWLAGTTHEPLDVVAMHVLGFILLGNDAAPLKKALIDSKLGQDLTATAFAAIGIEQIASVGLKGSEPDRAEAFQKLVMDTLRDIADHDLPREHVLAALHQAAYYFREIQSSYPIRIMDMVTDSWVYDEDPLRMLNLGRLLDVLRAQWEETPDTFNRLIRERLLDNPHRLRVCLRPDPEWQARNDAAFAEKMAAKRAELSDDQMRRIARKAKELEKESSTPNTPEALATLPQLTKNDLPDHPRRIPHTLDKLTGNITFLRNDVFTNGVNYLRLAFDLQGLPDPLWERLPRFREAITRYGALDCPYHEMARRKAAGLGSLHTGVHLGPHRAGHNARNWHFVVSLKALDEQFETALDILEDLLFRLDTNDPDRMREVLVQSFAQCRSGLVQDGLDTVLKCARSTLTESHSLMYRVFGIPQFPRLATLSRGPAEDLARLAEDLDKLREFLVVPNRLSVGFTGCDAAAGRLRQRLESWSDSVPPRPIEYQPVGFHAPSGPSAAGLAAPLQISHSVRAMPAPHMTHPDAPSLTVGAQLLTFDYAISELRFRGNAYGAGCSFSNNDFRIHAYADPHTTRTLGVFDGLREFVEKADWSQTDIDRAVISAAKGALSPIRPENATRESLDDYLTGRTHDFLTQYLQGMRAATPAGVQRALLELLEAGEPLARTAMMASRERLEAANKELDNPMAIQDVLSEE